MRLEGVSHRYREDHISAKGINSLTHFNLVHEFIPMLQALKILDAKAAVEKEWETLRKLPAWQLTKVRNKKEVIEEAKNKGRKVHFASLMDLCHLKNSELEPQYQKYKGRVVLRGGSYAAFTEQGISASQNDSRKSHGHYFKTARMRRTSSRCSILLNLCQNGRCIDVIANSKVRMSRYLDTSTETQKAKIIFQHGRPSHSS